MLKREEEKVKEEITFNEIRTIQIEERTFVRIREIISRVYEDEKNKYKYKIVHRYKFFDAWIKSIPITEREKLFEFIKLIELLKSFAGGKLSEHEKYRINNNIYLKRKQGNPPILTIQLDAGGDISLKRFECGYLATCFNKILQKIEVF